LKDWSFALWLQAAVASSSATTLLDLPVRSRFGPNSSGFAGLHEAFERQTRSLVASSRLPVMHRLQRCDLLPFPAQSE
jgi:hypothetical protein